MKKWRRGCSRGAAKYIWCKNSDIGTATEYGAWLTNMWAFARKKKKKLTFQRVGDRSQPKGRGGSCREKGWKVEKNTGQLNGEAAKQIYTTTTTTTTNADEKKTRREVGKPDKLNNRVRHCASDCFCHLSRLRRWRRRGDQDEHKRRMSWKVRGEKDEQSKD